MRKDKGSGLELPIPTFWCPATCGRCKGDDKRWRTVKPLGNTGDHSKNPTVFSVAGVPISVYKSAVVFTSRVRSVGGPELHVGPYYYAHGFDSDQYTKAAADIVLPTIKPPYGKPGNYCYEAVPREDKLAAYRPRMPCVSLGVSAQRSLDIGIENYGSGWYGYYFAGEDPAGKNQKAYNKAYVGANGKYTPPMHTDATSASIQLECSRDEAHDKVVAVIKLYKTVGKARKQLSSITLQYVHKRGAFFYGNEMARFHFYRLMSFLPKGGSEDPLWDRSDGCQMLNGQLQNLRLYNRVTKAWEMWNWDKTEYAWSGQAANIRSLDIGSRKAKARNMDIASYHTKEWHFA